MSLEGYFQMKNKIPIFNTAAFSLIKFSFDGDFQNICPFFGIFSLTISSLHSLFFSTSFYHNPPSFFLSPFLSSFTFFFFLFTFTTASTFASPHFPLFIDFYFYIYPLTHSSSRPPILVHFRMYRP